MAFQAVPNVAMLEVVYETPSGMAENTLYYVKGTPGDYTLPDLQDLSLAFASVWVGQWQPLNQPIISLREIKATYLGDETGPVFVFTDDLPVTGTGSGAILPMNVTIAVTFNTGLRGRSYRGRNYWIQLSEGQVIGDLVDVATVESIVDAFEAIKTLGESPAPVFNHVVVSRYTDNALRPSGIYTAVDSYSANRVIDSQRRRLDGRGI